MLVGRDDEILRITSLIDQSLLGAGHLRFVQIDGEIGAGKSALLAAVVGSIREASASRGDSADASTTATSAKPYVLLVPGDRQRVNIPLHTFRVLCEDLLSESLEALLDTSTPATLALRCIEALGETPLVLAVDDADLLDSASLTFLDSLMQHPSRGPVTILVAHRFGHTPWHLLMTARRRGALLSHHTVEELSDQAIASMAAGLPDHQTSAVVKSSGGNPLVAHSAIAGFQRYPSAWQVEEVLTYAGYSQGSALALAVATDLDTLSESARKTLEALAMLGDTDAETISQVTGLDRERVRDSAQELVERGFVTNNPRKGLHPVVRFSVYQNTDPERRARIHRRAADLPSAELSDRAEHLTGVLTGGGLFGATEYALTDADVRVLIEASRLAIGSDPRAVRRWLGSLASGRHTPQSEMLLARAMILTGDFDDAIDRLQSLLEREPLPEAQILQVHALRMIGQTDEARALLASAHEWAHGDDPTLLREYIDVLALIDGNAPDELVSRLESLPDSNAEGLNRAVAAIYRVMTLLSQGRVPEARVTFERVTNWARRASNEEFASVSHATCAAVWAAYILDEYEIGASIARRALRLARRHGQADVRANLGTGLSFCLAASGLLDNAEDAAEQAIHDATMYGPASLESMARAGLLIVAQGRNQPELLQQRFDELSAVPLPEFGWFRRAVLTTRTRISALLGRPEPSLELLGKPKDAMAALRYADAAIVAAVQGDTKAAKTFIADGIAIADEQQQHGQRAMLLATEAELCLRARNALQASNLFRAARDIFEQRDMKLQLGRAQAGIARAEAALAAHAEPLKNLTKREREIAEVIAEGLSNREIAERLVLSHRTVENHVRNILKKLQVESRQDVAEMLA